ncbi:MAG: DEAD/DEAH box helicase [Calditrichaeota bacterium]|nr:DEAD/DEAH box helicase [Calditrichota bacterium]
MSVSGKRIKVAISSELLEVFSRIPLSHHGKVRDFIEKFQANPTSPGINYEKIEQWKDPNLRSVRIDQNYRGVVLKPEKGNVYTLLWVGKHDDAYRWGKDKSYQVHPITGSLQVVPVESVPVTSAVESPAPEAEGLFRDYRDRNLIRLGVPETLLPRVRRIHDEADLDAAAAELPQEVYEALFMLAAGYGYEDVLREMAVSETPEKVDVEDFDTALDRPDSRRRFYVVEDAGELKDILNFPLAHWRVFLHPSQRKLIEKNFNGPARVLGGAGTGKTVVAMHRAKYLVGLTGENEKILFTTFTRNLAEDIRQNLQKIVPEKLMPRIEVINLDAWVGQFLQRNGYEYRMTFGRESAPYWENALNLAPAELGLDDAFYEDEWQHVIQAQGITNEAAYMRAARLGRGRRLGRLERKKIWPVFEEYRAQLNQNGLKEFTDALRDARLLLAQQGDILPYRAVIVDEAQDFSMEAFKLIRQIIPERDNSRNDIFIVGDAHQRIYGHRITLSHCGIAVRGRGHRLRINYRTTEETRNWAVGLLSGWEIDDLDGGADEQRGYKSLLHGQSPRVVNFPTFREEVQHILEYIYRLQKSAVPLLNICLAARTNDLLKQYEGALSAAGLDTYYIKRSVADDPTHPGVRLATMHRVKGIEFDYMIIAGVNAGIIPLKYLIERPGDPITKAENELRERALLYVAATRARKEVLVSSFGEKSGLLPGD